VSRQFSKPRLCLLAAQHIGLGHSAHKLHGALGANSQCKIPLSWHIQEAQRTRFVCGAQSLHANFMSLLSSKLTKTPFFPLQVSSSMLLLNLACVGCYLEGEFKGLKVWKYKPYVYIKSCSFGVLNLVFWNYDGGDSSPFHPVIFSHALTAQTTHILTSHLPYSTIISVPIIILPLLYHLSLYYSHIIPKIPTSLKVTVPTLQFSLDKIPWYPLFTVLFYLPHIWKSKQNTKLFIFTSDNMDEEGTEMTQKGW